MSSTESRAHVRAVEETVDMRLRDESSWVRQVGSAFVVRSNCSGRASAQVSLDLLGRILEGSLAEAVGLVGIGFRV